MKENMNWIYTILNDVERNFCYCSDISRCKTHDIVDDIRTQIKNTIAPATTEKAQGQHTTNKGL